MRVMRFRFKTYRKKILWFSALVLALVLVLVRCSASVNTSPAEPVKGVQTEQNVCSVTVSLTGIESEEALRLLMSVCRGTGVVPYVFVTVDWLEEHSDALSLLEGGELGLLFSESPEKWTQKRTMAAIAEANDAFMVHTGSFPKYVRIAEGGCSQTVADVLHSYGQELLSSSCSLTEDPFCGAIIDCGLLDSTTGYQLAQFYGSTLSRGYSILSLSELMQA